MHGAATPLARPSVDPVGVMQPSARQGQSGWDLKRSRRRNAGVRLVPLLEMRKLEALGNENWSTCSVRICLDSSAPNPSVEPAADAFPAA